MLIVIVSWTVDPLFVCVYLLMKCDHLMQHFLLVYTDLVFCCVGVRSHRLPLKRKYTIIKKIKEHKRKQARDLRRNPEKKRKPRSDKGVPNSCPFKEEILADMEKQKKAKEAEQAAKRAEILEKRKQMREAKLAEKRGITMESLAKDAEKRDTDFQGSVKPENEEPKKESFTDNSFKAYFKEFRKVIEAADVILEVLDARDPIGTRCHAVEQAVLDAGTNKRLVLVLNKAGKFLAACIGFHQMTLDLFSL